MKGYSGHSIANAYRQTQVIHSNPADVIVMLYEGALSRIAEAKQRFAERNIVYGGIAVTKAQAIINELRRSLNMETGGELAMNLDRLYFYIHELLVRVNVENRVDPLTEASSLLDELRGAWVEVARQCKDLLENDPLLQGKPALPVDASIAQPQLSLKA